LKNISDTAIVEWNKLMTLEEFDDLLGLIVTVQHLPTITHDMHAR
jgi:hypothetical protein